MYESWPKGSLWEDLQNDMNWLTLTFSQDHSIYWKLGKSPFLTIFGSRVLMKGQGHSVYLKVRKYLFVIILDNISDTIYGRVMKLGLMIACG